MNDTFACGGVIIVGGRQYVVAEHTFYPTNGGISMNIIAVAYENVEPMVRTFMTPGCKPKKKSKSKRKVSR